MQLVAEKGRNYTTFDSNYLSDLLVLCMDEDFKQGKS